MARRNRDERHVTPSPTLSRAATRPGWKRSQTSNTTGCRQGPLSPRAVAAYPLSKSPVPFDIIAALSRVGLAAIQVAGSVGATTIAVTRTSAKKQALLELGAAHVVASAGRGTQHRRDPALTERVAPFHIHQRRVKPARSQALGATYGRVHLTCVPTSVLFDPSASARLLDHRGTCAATDLSNPAGRSSGNFSQTADDQACRADQRVRRRRNRAHPPKLSPTRTPFSDPSWAPTKRVFQGWSWGGFCRWEGNTSAGSLRRRPSAVTERFASLRSLVLL